ncbi:hypothetical protein ABPG72_018455 [Tetrahymena utriculariae]
MDEYKKLMQNNREWAAKMRLEDPQFFLNTSKEIEHKYLWIGCSDSRVSAEQLTCLQPGDIIVHRNVANQVIHTDLNCLSAIQGAVDFHKVEHVIVCGHYNCGGVKAAVENPNLGLINNWILHIRDIYLKHKRFIDSLKGDEKFNKMSELNTIEQVYNLGNTTVLQNAWQNKQNIQIHGWVYGLNDGRIKDLRISSSNYKELVKNYKRAIKELKES